MIWERYPGELAHHGIKGQKWGVKNGPPYPLKAQDHSSSEKKFLSRGYGDYSEIAPIVSTALVALAAVSVKEAYAKAKRTKAINDQLTRNVAKHQGKTFDDIPKIGYHHDRDADMKAINPDFSSSYARQFNCALCSTAYELRRRGYDVKANDSYMGLPNDVIGKWFNIKEKDYTYIKKDDKNLSKMKAELSRYPDGSRGMINAMVALKPGAPSGGHSMIWEKDNGKIIIRDAQRNEKYDDIEHSVIANGKPRMAYIIRTDNLTINKNKILEAIEF